MKKGKFAIGAVLGLAVMLTALFTWGCGKKISPAEGTSGVPGVTPARPPMTGPGAATAPGQETVLEVFVPCAFGPASSKIAKLFEAANPGVRLNRVVENVSVLAPKIAAGAKPDLFLCNGDREVMALEEKGLVAEKRDFCFTSLVLIVPKANPAGVKSIRDLTKPSVKTIAIGSPETSVGYYAEEVLKQAGVWDQVQKKLVRPKFPVELMKLAAQGKVQASIAYGTCFKSEEGEHKQQAAKLKLIADFKADYCQTVACQAMVVKGCKHPELASKLAEFLTTPECQAIFAKAGFMTLDETKCYEVPGEKAGSAAGAGKTPATPAKGGP
ncbi:MAG: molybdate ABC transporter substrate-binding protein [Armatimonadetes bacterium]|nr:molybdate ABC transporter substrate-binding protein [Armatimonadota bacterium]